MQWALGARRCISWRITCAAQLPVSQVRLGPQRPVQHFGAPTALHGVTVVAGLQLSAHHLQELLCTACTLKRLDRFHTCYNTRAAFVIGRYGGLHCNWMYHLANCYLQRPSFAMPQECLSSFHSRLTVVRLSLLPVCAADANILINTCRNIAQRYFFAYQEPMPVEQLVRSLCDTKQVNSRRGAGGSGLAR